MVEIVFSESACGSLKIAQTYGRGKYRGSAISVFIRHENGSVPSSNEMKEAQLQAQEQECIAWENAIPLGGKSSDVYCFDMALSVGDISDTLPLRWLPPATLLWTCHLGTSCIASCSQPTSFIKYAIFSIGNEV